MIEKIDVAKFGQFFDFMWKEHVGADNLLRLKTMIAELVR